MSEMSIAAHEVPKNRPWTDIDQRLGHGIRMLPETGSETAAKQYDFQLALRFKIIPEIIESWHNTSQEIRP